MLGGCDTAAAPAACPNDLPATCPSGVPSYADTVAAIIERRCLGCHAPGTRAADHDLTTHANVFRQRTQVLTRVYACIMPPEDGTPLTDGERAALLAWLVCDAPDN